MVVMPLEDTADELCKNDKDIDGFALFQSVRVWIEHTQGTKQTVVPQKDGNGNRAFKAVALSSNVAFVRRTLANAAHDKI